MTIEEKARAYDEALDRAKIYSEGHTLDVNPQAAMEYVFPELRESKEEKIRNTLIDLFKNRLTYYGTKKLKDLKVDDILAWLEKQGKILESIKHKEAMLDCQTCANYKNECFPDRNIFKCSYPIKCSGEKPQDVDEKQGEQKPANKVEPKFKDDDWIISDTASEDYRVVKINEIKDGNYHITSIYGYQGFNSFNVFEKDYHLWTIKDAKEGDILQADKCTLIFDSLTKDMDGNTVISSWYYCDTETFYGMGTCKPDLWVTEGVVPATKKQRDFLFQKMKEAGYKWDSEKKELKKIEQKMINEHNEYEPTSYEVEKWNEAYEKGYEIGYMNGKIEQKPTEWSKQQVVNALTKWLTEKIAPLHKKSLDGTITEREDMFETALLELRSFVNSPSFQIGKDVSKDWSEEDEKRLERAIHIFEDNLENFENTGISDEIDESLISWIKSLKERIK